MSDYYVYKLIDPSNNIPFYVGKGCGDRAKSHLWNKAKTNNPRKDQKIEEIRLAGHVPLIEYVQTGLSSSDAYLLEEQLIRQYGRLGFDQGGILTNIKKDARPPSQKGTKKQFTEEHRKNLSNSLRGKPKKNPPWNKGLTKSSDSRLAKSADNRSKVGNNHQIGMKYSEDRVEKIRCALKGRKLSDSSKSKMSTAKKGKTWEQIYGVEGAAQRRKSKKLGTAGMEDIRV